MCRSFAIFEPRPCGAECRCEENSFAPAEGSYIHLRVFDEVDQRYPWIVPAGMRIDRGGGGSQLDGERRVRAAHEVQPVAEDDCVIGHPACGSEQQDNRSKDEICAKETATAVEADGHGEPDEEGEYPAVVARIDCRSQHGDDGPEQVLRAAFVGIERRVPFDDEEDGPDELAEEERLGHRRGLHVKQIGVGGEECKREAGGSWREPFARQLIEAETGEQVASRAGNDRSEAAAPPGVDQQKRNQQQVRQRQPDGAELRDAGSVRIEETPRDVDVRFGVSIEQEGRMAPSSTRQP